MHPSLISYHARVSDPYVFVCLCVSAGGRRAAPAGPPSGHDAQPLQFNAQRVSVPRHVLRHEGGLDEDARCGLDCID